MVLWFATERQRLKPGELGAILEPENEIGVSAVSIWELRIKWNRRYQSGMRKGPFHPEVLLEALSDFRLPVHALTAEQCAAQLDTPLVHNDPFDDLLLNVAQVTGHRLLTRDEKLRGHPLAFHAG
jgi:PIN domain nuclease of toxin-antitoxin system